jgi:hypothetical protein
MNKKILIFLISLIILSAAGCSKKNQLENLADPTSEHALNTWSPEWVLYDNEIKTGGGIALYTNGSAQVLDVLFNDAGNNKAIRFSWNGDEVFDYNENRNRADFTGFGLTTSVDMIKNIAAFNARDISGGGYNTLTFSLKGELSNYTSVIIEGPQDSNSNCDSQEFNKDTITSEWKDYSFTLSKADLSKIKSFVNVIFAYRGNYNTKGSGGTVYIDNIRLLKK